MSQELKLKRLSWKRKPSPLSQAVACDLVPVKLKLTPFSIVVTSNFPFLFTSTINGSDTLQGTTLKIFTAANANSSSIPSFSALL